MHDNDRMRRQLALLRALETVLASDPSYGKSTAQMSIEAKAALVVAARIEEFSDTWGENIHRAGEGI